MVLTLLGMIFFNLVSAITTEYAVYVLARFEYHDRMKMATELRE